MLRSALATTPQNEGSDGTHPIIPKFGTSFGTIWDNWEISEKNVLVPQWSEALKPMFLHQASKI